MTSVADKAKNVSQPKDHKLIVEKDVAIPMRDGAVIYADVFRPDTTEPVPIIMNIGVYMKDKLWVPPEDLEEKPNPYMNWESGNPLWWCPRNYAIVRVDARGSGKSPGRSEPSSYAESLDYYDAVEWMAKRPWSNGKVGTLGISYLAASQWRLANLNPPSLKCILPWEGRADQYRDQAYHGGIFAMGFIGSWYLNWTAQHLLGRTRSHNPQAFNNNMMWEYMSHSLDSGYWREASAKWDQIKVPVYSAGNWTSFSLHLRGNTEPWLNLKKNKKLRIHSGTHFHAFYSEEGRQDQLRWFDYWLKGIDTGIMDEPPVKLEIRTGGKKGRYDFRFEDDFPIPHEVDQVVPRHRARAQRQARGHRRPVAAGQSEGREEAHLQRRSRAARRRRAPSQWLFLPDAAHGGGHRDHRSAGDERVGVEHHRGRRPHGDAAQHRPGWQGSAGSRPAGPAHRAHQGLAARFAPQAGQGEVAAVPPVPRARRALVADARLRVDIQSQDGVGTGVYTHFSNDYKAHAQNSIHSGGAKESYLLVPIIPAK